MSITPYKQTLSHSCLAACFLMLQDKKFTEEDEQKLALQGSKRKYPFYVSGITMESVKSFDKKVEIYVDNKYFGAALSNSFKEESRIKVIPEKITQTLIEQLILKSPIICHIDIHAFGDYSHASHFIVIEKKIGNFFTIIDPWDGVRKRVASNTLIEAISDLKNQIKMCPLLFTLPK